MKANVKRSTVVVAFAIAICADLLQIGLAPLLAEGFASPFEDFVDIFACVILTTLLGWHLSFLPSFLVKLFPVWDLAPTWTIAVLIATRGYWKGMTGNGQPPVINEQKGRVVDVEASVEGQTDGASTKERQPGI